MACVRQGTTVKLEVMDHSNVPAQRGRTLRALEQKQRTNVPYALQGFIALLDLQRLSRAISDITACMLPAPLKPVLSVSCRPAALLRARVHKTW
jgi:hypothetical protein